MGASASSLIGPLSRSKKIGSQDELVAKTEDMTKMADKLFEFMYKNFKPSEVWDIALKPEEYVISLSELIQKHFDIIGYTTDRTIQGEIYFKKYDALKFDKLRREEKENHIRNSKIIAFYFVRIFQIMGAMLLVIKDSSADLSGSASSIDDTDRPILGLPRVYYPQRGGTIPPQVVLGPFEFLRPQLERPDPKTIALFVQKPETEVFKIRNTNLLIRFKAFGAPITQETINTKSPEFIILLKDKSSKREYGKEVPIYVLNMSPLELSADVTKVNLQFLMFRIKPSERKNEIEKNKEANLIVIEQTADSPTVKRYSIRLRDPIVAQAVAGGDYTAVHDMKYILERIFFLHSVTSDPSHRPDLLQIYDRARGEEEDVGKEGQHTPKSVSNPMIQKGLELMAAKEGKHCIKRAIQLLDPLSIFDKSLGPSVTKVCKFTLPGKEAETSLEDYGPTNTLAQLYGKIDVRKEEFEKSKEVLQAFISTKDALASGHTMTVSQLRTSSQDEAADMKAALKRLETAFRSVKSNLEQFGDIKVTKPEECGEALKNAAAVPDGKGLSDGGIVVSNDNLKRRLRDVSQELLAYHVNSTIEITKFLKRIFNIDKDSSGYWVVKGIKESFLIAGFPALDSVTDIARDLLLEYYDGCETRYQKGVDIWKGENKAPAAAPVPAPSAAPAPVPAAPAPVPVAPAAPSAAPSAPAP